MFTKDTLALLHGKAKPIQGAGDNGNVAWREEYDEIDDKAVDKAKNAWRNWVDMNAFIHPGLMDCVAAYRCVTDTPNLSVKTLTDFFNKHLGKNTKGRQKVTKWLQKTERRVRKGEDQPSGTLTVLLKCSARS